MQMVLSFFRHDDVAAITRYATISCLMSLVAIAALAAFDIAYIYPGN